jgi:beta-galactosidase
LTEAELDAYDELGFYRYPPDRPLAQALGLNSLGRRSLEGVMEVALGAGVTPIRLPTAGWLEALTPDGSEVISRSANGDAVAVRRPVGRGQVISLGSFPGLSYARNRHPGLEQLVVAIAERAGVKPSFAVEPSDGEVVQWRSGVSGDTRLLFLTSEAGPGRVGVRARPNLLAGAGPPVALIGQASDQVVAAAGWAQLEVELSPDGVAVVAWDQAFAGRAPS